MLIKSQQRFKSDHHKVYKKEVNKIALSSNDDKRIQTFDEATTYQYGTNAFMVCENKIKYVLQRKNMINNDSQIVKSESQALRDKSFLLRNETQALRTNSLVLRNELKELKA